MKLRILFVAILLVKTFSISAQTFADRSKGFFLDFSTSCLNNFAPNSGGIAYDGGNLESTIFTGQGYLEITNPANVSFNTNPIFMDLYYEEGGFCQRVHDIGSPELSMDLSGVNSKVVVYARASVPTQVKFFLGFAGNSDPSQSWNNSGTIPDKIMSLTTTSAAYEFDFAAWSGRDSVSLYGFVIKEPNASIYIEKIIFGDAAISSTYDNTIKGKVYGDDNSDCSYHNGEQLLNKVLVQSTTGSHTYFGFSDEDGNYSISVDGGNMNEHTVSQQLNERNKMLLSNTCPPTYTVNTDGFSSEFCCYNFGNDVRQCTMLNVEISSDKRRRCYRNTTIVEYTNYGAVAETDVEVKVVYPQYVVPISSIPAWTSIVGDTIVYSIGSLSSGSSGRIFITDSVQCGMEEIRYMTQCTQAIITPRSTCISESPLWDRASVTIEGHCERGQSYFKIKNEGDGDMQKVSTCRVYLNDTLIYSNNFRLTKGDFFTIRYPYQGSTVRVEADQVSYHPGQSKPSFTLEGCVGTEWLEPITGFVITAPQDDLDDNYAVSCMQIRDSYDPNDKSVSPVGKGPKKMVRAGDRLHYTVRFQNTGSDVAYNIKVVDTLDTNFDFASFEQSSSSHNYRIDISGKDRPVLTFYFDNIDLVDSTTNEQASHGFVSFYINTLSDLADGVEIKNTAGIYFDYNSPIITNTVSQTIGDFNVIDLKKGTSIEVVGIEEELVAPTVFPNPSSQNIKVDIGSRKEGEIIFYDVYGREHFRSEIRDHQIVIHVSTWTAGLYLYKIRSNEEEINAGKLIVK